MIIIEKHLQLWQYFRDEVAVNVANGDVIDFNAVKTTVICFKLMKI